MADGGQNNRVNIVNKWGETQSIDMGELDAALSKGYHLETPEEFRKRRLQEEYGGTGGELAAGALGAGRALSFGLTDVAAKQLGKEEDVKLLREANPTATTVGEVGGTIASLALPVPKGGGILGKGARAITAPTRGVAELGIKTTQAAQKFLPAGKGLASRVLSSAAASAAGGALEGAAYGAAKAISEDALGNTDLTAESLLAEIGSGALIGGVSAGAASALFDVTGEGLRVGGKMLARGIKEAPEAAADVAEATGKRVAQASGKEKKEVFEAVTAPDVDKDLRDMVLGDAEARDRYLGKLAKNATSIDEGISNRIAQFEGDLRKEELGDLLMNVDPTRARLAYEDTINNAYRAIGEIDAAPEMYGKLNLKAQVQNVLDGLDERMKSKGMIDSAADVFDEVNQAKRRIDDLVRPFRKSLNTNPQNRAIVDKLDEVVSGLRSHTFDEAIYGAAGARQKAINNAYSKYIKAKESVLEGGENLGINRKINGRDVRVFGEQKMSTYLNQIGSERSAWKTKAFEDYMQAAQELVGEFETTAVASGKNIAGDLPDLIKSTAAARGEAEKALGEISKLRALDPGFLFLEHAAGGISGGKVLSALRLAGKAADPMAYLRASKGLREAGQYLGGKVDNLANMLDQRLGSIAEPLSEINAREAAKAENARRIIDRLVRSTAAARKSTSAAISSTLGAVDSSTKQKLIAPVAPSAVLMSTNFGEQKDKPKNVRQAAKRRSKELAELMANPDKLAARVAETTGPLADVAPKTAMKATQNLMKTVAFLHDKAPKRPTGPDVQLGLDDWEPSDVESYKFAKYVQAAMDPLSVVKNAATGTLTAEGVETLKELFPEIHQMTKEQVFAQAAELQDRIGFDKLTGLSLLLDIPLHPLHEPAAIARSQEGWQIKPQEGQGADGVRLSALDKLDVSKDLMTESQKLEART